MNVISSNQDLRFVKPHYYDAALNDNPHAFYADLRKHSPVCRTSDFLFRGREGYMVTRYDDVRFILTDPRFSSDPHNMAARPGFFSELLLSNLKLLSLITDSMVQKDDPDHRRLRGLVATAFTNRAVSQLDQYVQRTVERLYDDMSRRQTVDFVSEFSVPLPLAVIAEMLGVKPEDRDDFHTSMKKLSGGANGNPLQLLLSLPTGNRMLAMFRRLIAERRAAPDDKLISAIIQARYEGDRLDDDEVLGMIFLLLLAGHDTTANLISMSALMLSEHPDQLERLRENPELIQSAVEELLRFTAPVTTPGPRIPMEDLEIRGVPIARGVPILGMIISANRDEEMFTDPDTIDLGRTPNQHLGFGFGGHICLGLMLARLEARIALSTLVQRFKRIELAVPRAAIRYKTATLRGLKSLPLRMLEG